MDISKYTIGVGDRFAHQAEAQLQAFIAAETSGISAVPVWNKSNREHLTIGSEPVAVRIAADKAVQRLNWTKPYHVDADHIGLTTVDRFLDCSDFFTIDVADFIGKSAESSAIEGFLVKHPELEGSVRIPGIDREIRVTKEKVREVASQYLAAVAEAGRVYRYIENKKGSGNFICEVSMDETHAPQTPPELLIILAALADEKIPLQTLAPKFTGRFNKGVDYVGDIAQFEQEFNEDLAVLAYGIQNYGLPSGLKLSVHSGSDKFSIYPVIQRALTRTGAGLHLKTAGTSWLEEIIGLAEAGGDGLVLAREIYKEAHSHLEELCAPYAAVIDIDPAKLPAIEEVEGWSSKMMVAALRHDTTCEAFNPHMRQLLHVGYKIAAKMGTRYLDLLVDCRESVARNVTFNLLERHIKALFLK